MTPNMDEQVDSIIKWPPISPGLIEAISVQARDSLSLYGRSGVIEELEDAFAVETHQPWAIAMSSGTAALHSAYYAAELGPGSQVLSPAYTFFATIMPLLQLGARVTLVDSYPDGRMNLEAARQSLTPATRALVITHMWGDLHETEAYEEFCNENGLLLIEDCSHSFGATNSGRVPGEGADLAAWSLQAGKPLPAGEGGMLAGKSVDLRSRALLLGHFNKRCISEIPQGFDGYDLAETGSGLKYRMSTLSASVANYFLAQWGHYGGMRQDAGLVVESLLQSSENVSPLVSRNHYSQRSYYVLALESSGHSVATVERVMQESRFTWYDIPKSSRSLTLFPGLTADHAASYFPGTVDPADAPVAEHLSKSVINLRVPWTQGDGEAFSVYCQRLRDALQMLERLPSTRRMLRTHHRESDNINRVSVGALVVDEGGRVLLLKRSSMATFLPNMWDVPGGKVAVGESLRAALEREVQEETRLVVTSLQRYLGQFNYRGADGRRWTQKDYLVSFDGSAVTTSPPEHSEFRWFSESDLVEEAHSMTPETLRVALAAVEIGTITDGSRRARHRRRFP